MKNELYTKALTLAREGKRDEALRLLGELLRDDRNHLNGWKLRARLSQDAEEVAQSLREIIRIDPNDEKARDMLIRLR